MTSYAFNQLLHANLVLLKRFPSEKVLGMLTSHVDSIGDQTEEAVYNALSAPLRESIVPYTRSMAVGIPGSDRVLVGFLSILRKWVMVERWFCDASSYADAVDSLRRAHKTDKEVVMSVCRSHVQVATTSKIVLKIISLIGEGSRVDSLTSTTSPIGKRISVVTGAGSLPESLPCFAEIGSMGSRDPYAEVALKARKLLMQESMPSLAQRERKVLEAAVKLGIADVLNPSKEVDDFLEEHMPMVDVFFSVLDSVPNTNAEIGLLELYARHLYRTYTLKDLERHPSGRMLRFSFLNKPSESVISTTTSVTSMTDLTRIVSNKGSLSKMGEMLDSDSESSMLKDITKGRIPPLTVRSGACVIIEKIDDLGEKLQTIMSAYPCFEQSLQRRDSGPVNVLYLIVSDKTVGSDIKSGEDVLAKRCERILEPHHDMLAKADVRRVSFVFRHEDSNEFDDHTSPAVFTYRFPEYTEDSLYRRIAPSHAFLLDLNRVAANFRVRSLGSRHTSTCQIHLYEGTPRPSALVKDKRANQAPRIFARALSFVLEFSSSSFEKILVDALNALDLCVLKSKSDNHLFVNWASDFEKAVLDPLVVEEIVVAILKRHGDRVANLGIAEVEMRIVCRLSHESPPIALRLVASNPTGYVLVMNTYVEAADETGTERIFKLIGGTKASLASSGDSSWEGMKVRTPYPLTRPFDAQRQAALQASDTLYCYDLPALFEAAVEQQWLGASEMGGIEGGIRAAARPLMVMYTAELVVQKKNSPNGSPWTMKDYLNGELEILQVNRGAGANDVGMVAWLMVLNTVEYPNVRLALL